MKMTFNLAKGEMRSVSSGGKGMFGIDKEYRALFSGGCEGGIMELAYTTSDPVIYAKLMKFPESKITVEFEKAEEQKSNRELVAENEELRELLENTKLELLETNTEYKELRNKFGKITDVVNS